MRDSVSSAIHCSVCNVLRLWRISLIPTYRVYPLYDIDTMIIIVTVVNEDYKQMGVRMQ